MTADTEKLRDSLSRLIAYMERENYRGYDPYDFLLSPLTRLPLLRSNKKIRFYFQQLGKRLPVNLRPFLRIPKGLNPVSLGLSIQAYSRLFRYGEEKESQVSEKIRQLISQLESLVPKGYHGACWGYDFPWEARYASIPAYQPTVVATGIISNALYECYRLTGNEKAKELCIGAARFVKHDLNRSFDGDSFCFSYSPFDQQQVLNASMKGVRILAQAFALTGEEEMKLTARRAVDFVLSRQQPDGSWPYSLASTGSWTDHYHTGYVLDCLDEYGKHTGDPRIKIPLEKGYSYYVNSFFRNGYQPKFYNHSFYPQDCTAAAQGILSLLRFGDKERARRAALFTIQTMQAPGGYFYFRKHTYYSQKTSYMRWSNAWMFAALATLLAE